jgi:hypothetical protein
MISSNSVYSAVQDSTVPCTAPCKLLSHATLIVQPVPFSGDSFVLYGVMARPPEELYPLTHSLTHSLYGERERERERVSLAVCP